MSSIRPSRGKAAPRTARPLNAAGSRPRPHATNPKPSTPIPKTDNVPRVQSSKIATVQPLQSQTRVEPSTRVRATTTLKGTGPGGTTSVPSAPPSSVFKEHTRSRTQETASVSVQDSPDSPQVAAQACAWKYMSSTLEIQLDRTRKAAHNALETRQGELMAEEADIAEGRVRYEAERLLHFYDELSDKRVAEDIAAMFQRFTAVEKTVGEITATALRLTSLPLNETTDVSDYIDALIVLDSLEDECHDLQLQFDSLSTKCSPSSVRILALFQDLLDILQGHIDNLACAKTVVQCCKENYRLGLGTLTLD